MDKRRDADSATIQMSPPLNFTEAILDPVVSNFSKIVPFPLNILSRVLQSGSVKTFAAVLRHRKKLLTWAAAENRSLHRIHVDSLRHIFKDLDRSQRLCTSRCCKAA